MTFGEIKESLTSAQANVKSYLENSDVPENEPIFMVFMRSISAGALVLLVGTATLLALLLLSKAHRSASGNGWFVPFTDF